MTLETAVTKQHEHGSVIWLIVSKSVNHLPHTTQGHLGCLNKYFIAIPYSHGERETAPRGI